MKYERANLPTRLKSTMMGMLSGWVGRPISLRDGKFWSLFTGYSNWTGEPVSVDAVLQNATAMACVRLNAETMSTLPCFLYKRKGDANEVATGHNLYRLLHDQPNADMTAVTFWQVYFALLLLRGGAHVEVTWSGNTPIALYPLDFDRVTWRFREDKTIEWKYNDPATGVNRVIPERDMWFTPAFTLDGFHCVSPISMGANVFGAAIAADKASANTFKNGMKASGLVTMDAVLKGTQREEVRAHVKAVSDKGGYFVLEKGSGFQQLNMTPQDSELLATRSFSVEEICRWFRTDPSLVGHGGKDSNWGTGLEQKMLWLVTLALRPMAVRVEQSIKKHLLSPAERGTMFAEFALEGLLRGDSAARAAFYASAAQNGWLTRNEIRQLENRPRVDGGDELTVQSNLVPLAQLGAAQAPDATNVQNALTAWLDINKDK